ncbi:MAG: hypothetical protein GEU95_13835 [Rhizobiales bacterium]|nr:hypothetical protein [Hyphomicrobiales bacterium]
MTARATIGIVAALLLGVADAAMAQAQAPAKGPVPDFDYTVGPVPKDETPPQAAPSQAAPRPPASAVRRAQRRPAPKRTVRQQRAPTRIIVRPRPMLRERLDSTEFPRSDNLGFPGRNAVRQCTSWLATEYRLSGTVVTPQMRCWWERG